MTKRNVEGQTLPTAADIAWARERLELVVRNTGRVIFGKDEVIRQVLAAFCAQGHVLLEDQPGVGKTLMARAIAKSLDVSVNRIQYTPDVVPSDVTGTVIFSRQESGFQFRQGPVFTNILLADEVNRGTPRTQSSLLEAMEERAVTVDGVRHELPSPFFVIATQNPLELHGTFPLPESQLDRFMIRLSLGFPASEHEDQMIRTYCAGSPLDELKPCLTHEELAKLLRLSSAIYIGPDVRQYLLSIVAELRNDPRVRMGVSPRGSLSLARAAQSQALGDGRDSVLPDDVKSLAVNILGHRIVTHSHSDDPVSVVEEALHRIPVPVDSSGH
jgi:MoxR-like ATPase